MAGSARSQATPAVLANWRVLTQVYKFNVPTFGPGVVYDVDVSIRTEQIRFFAESLKTQKLKSYVPLFVMEAEVRSAEANSSTSPLRRHRREHCLSCAGPSAQCIHSAAQEYFAKWGDEGIVDLKDELSELIILTASRTLLGELHCPVV